MTKLLALKYENRFCLVKPHVFFWSADYLEAGWVKLVILGHGGQTLRQSNRCNGVVRDAVPQLAGRGANHLTGL